MHRDAPDPIVCPECNGQKVHRLTPELSVLCEFCHGRGYVGGSDDPHEMVASVDRGERPPPTPPPVWEDPTVLDSGLCPHCLGSGKVASTGSGFDDDPRYVVEAACPACASTA
jgi:hypothetical protein